MVPKTCQIVMTKRARTFRKLLSFKFHIVCLAQVNVLKLSTMIIEFMRHMTSMVMKFGQTMFALLKPTHSQMLKYIMYLY